MKKKLILIFLAGTFSVFSQEVAVPESKISVGVEGGFTLNKFRTSGFDGSGLDYGSKASFAAGVNFSYSIFSYLNVKASLNYENKGTKFSYPTFGYGYGYGYIYGNTVEGRYNFNYINLPIVVSYQYHISKFNLYAGVGPNLSYLMGANGESTEDPKESISAYCSSFDFGLVGEAGASYVLNSKFLVDLSFREIFGLIDVISDPGAVTEYKTNSMGLMLGVKYRL